MRKEYIIEAELSCVDMFASAVQKRMCSCENKCSNAVVKQGHVEVLTWFMVLLQVIQVTSASVAAKVSSD